MSDATCSPTPGAPGEGPRTAKSDRRRAAWARRRAAVPSATERAALGAGLARGAQALVTGLGAGPLVVCSYESWPSEPPTALLNRALADAGHEVLVPITLADLDLDWRRLDDPDDPASGLGAAALARVDLVLAPDDDLLAMNKVGHIET